MIVFELTFFFFFSFHFALIFIPFQELLQHNTDPGSEVAGFAYKTRIDPFGTDLRTFSASLPESHLIFIRYDSHLKYMDSHNPLSSFYFFMGGSEGTVMNQRPRGLCELCFFFFN